MQLTYRNFFKSFNRNILHTIFILICWCSSLFLGMYLALQVKVYNLLMMRTFLESRMSIVSLACVVILPLLISMIAFRLDRFTLLLTVVCIKACAFGFSCSVVYAFFGDAGWLVRWLLIFTDSILVISQLYYWLRNALTPSRSVYQGVPAYLLLSALLISLEHCFISPLVVSLSERML